MPRKHTNTPALQANAVLTKSSAIEENPSLGIPNVDGLTLTEAALAYVSAGWFVVPVRPGTKNPGSVLGAEWPDQSSRDPGQIEQGWDEDPDYGIALHVGKSGAIVFDLDVENLNALPGEMREGLRKGPSRAPARERTTADTTCSPFLRASRTGTLPGRFCRLGRCAVRTASSSLRLLLT